MYTGEGKEILPKKILIAAALCFAAVVIIGGSISGLAKARRQEQTSYKSYSSIMVKKGDTLWSIASENMTPEYDRIEEYIEEIRNLNHLYGDGIRAGEYLAIPCYLEYDSDF